MRGGDALGSALEHQILSREVEFSVLGPLDRDILNLCMPLNRGVSQRVEDKRFFL